MTAMQLATVDQMAASTYPSINKNLGKIEGRLTLEASMLKLSTSWESGRHGRYRLVPVSIPIVDAILVPLIFVACKRESFSAASVTFDEEGNLIRE